jgi:hypothetical protein
LDDRQGVLIGGDRLTTGGAGKSLSTRVGPLVEVFNRWCLNAALLAAGISDISAVSWFSSGLNMVREARALGAGV